VGKWVNFIEKRINETKGRKRRWNKKPKAPSEMLSRSRSGEENLGIQAENGNLGDLTFTKKYDMIRVCK
jgi:hypothetical protein